MSREYNSEYKKSRELPVFKHRLNFLWAVEQHNVTIIIGETGSGKSTQLPQYLYESGWCDPDKKIIVSVPRRVAAMTVSARVAKEMRTALGHTVGYAVRFDDKTSATTKIKFVTDGLLLKEVMGDPLLSEYSVVVVDDAHDRSLSSDVLLGLLKRIVRVRPDLRVVVSSATIDAQAFFDFFNEDFLAAKDEEDDSPPSPARRPPPDWRRNDGPPKSLDDVHLEMKRRAALLLNPGRAPALPPALPPAPPKKKEQTCKVCVLSIDGRTFPVAVHYTAHPVADYVKAAVETALHVHDTNPLWGVRKRRDLRNESEQDRWHRVDDGPVKGDGDILIFLAGQDEVETAVRMLDERRQQLPFPNSLLPLPLYSQLPQHRQLAVFAPPEVGQRKVIVATNIAETAITLPHVEFVVDSCVVKTKATHPDTGIASLHVSPASQAACMQRTGRAGRVREGVCYRLLTEAAFHTLLPKQTVPDVMRTDLTETLLYLKCLGVSSLPAFQLITPPTTTAFLQALTRLHGVGAIDDKAQLVEPYGHRLAELPLDLELNRLVLLSLMPDFHCLEEALTIGAVMCAGGSLFTPPPRSDAGGGKEAMKRFSAAKRSFAAVEGDFLSAYNVYMAWEKEGTKGGAGRAWCERYFLNVQTLTRARDIREQTRRALERMGLVREGEVVSLLGHEVNLEGRGRVDVTPLLKAVCIAFFNNVVRREGEGEGEFVLVRGLPEGVSSPKLTLGGQSTFIPARAPEGYGEWLVFHEAVATNSETANATMNSVSIIKPEWLAELMPTFFRSREELVQELRQRHRREEEERARRKRVRPVADAIDLLDSDDDDDIVVLD